jgi:5-methylcytosine-specific restriction protein B
MRRVILQGPPGTGKIRLALRLLKEKYQGRGSTIQFYPNTTYENFIGGLASVHGKGDLGLQFEPKSQLMINLLYQLILIFWEP